MMQQKFLLTSLLFMIHGTQCANAGFFGSFNFSNLLYKVHACKNPNWICPEPHCKGPLAGPHPPPICENYQCDNQGNCVFAATQSMCNGNQACLNSYNYYNAADPDFYGDENTDSEGGEQYAYDGGDRSYIGGGYDSLNHQTSSSSTNYLPYYIVGGIVTVFIMGLLWRKREYINNEDLSEELGKEGNLHGSVKARLENMEAGRDVNPVHASSKTSFVTADGYVMA